MRRGTNNVMCSFAELGLCLSILPRKPLQAAHPLVLQGFVGTELDIIKIKIYKSSYAIDF